MSVPTEHDETLSRSRGLENRTKSTRQFPVSRPKLGIQSSFTFPEPELGLPRVSRSRNCVNRPPCDTAKKRTQERSRARLPTAGRPGQISTVEKNRSAPRQTARRGLGKVLSVAEALVGARAVSPLC